MAHKLKCWVKKVDNKNQTIYKKKDEILTIRRFETFPDAVFVKKIGMAFGERSISRRYKKTKNAEKFAYSYMKKHDRC